MKLSLIIPVLLIVLISGTTYAFAASQTVAVSAEDSERLSFYLKEGDRIKFQINVDGDRNDDIVLKIRNPTGGTMVNGAITEYYEDSFTAQESGNYSFEFDNDMSLLSSKRVNFSCDIIKRPVTQAITNTARDAASGCLIETATYSSELSPQVQQLREFEIIHYYKQNQELHS